MRAASAATRRDLPTPGSPEISTICPSPFQASRWRSSRKSISSSRPDEIGQTHRVNRLEAALGIGYAFDRPRCDRLAKTLHLMPTEAAPTEQIPEQPARGAGEQRPPPAHCPAGTS